MTGSRQTPSLSRYSSPVRSSGRRRLTYGDVLLTALRISRVPSMARLVSARKRNRRTRSPTRKRRKKMRGILFIDLHTIQCLLVERFYGFGNKAAGRKHGCVEMLKILSGEGDAKIIQGALLCDGGESIKRSLVA